MINFQETFRDSYQFYLKNIEYTMLTVGPVESKFDVKVKDDITYNLDADSKIFEYGVRRTVYFEPTVLYRLAVSFNARLTLNDSAPDLSGIDWESEFKNNPLMVSLLQELAARISALIAQITASYGQTPLITPPDLIY